MCIRDRLTLCNVAVAAAFPYYCLSSPFNRAVYGITCVMHIFMRQTVVLADPLLRRAPFSTRLVAAWCFPDLRLSTVMPPPQARTRATRAALHLVGSAGAAVVLFVCVQRLAPLRPTPAATDLTVLYFTLRDPVWWLRYVLGGCYFLAQLIACDGMYRLLSLIHISEPTRPY
eukprot:TRINITY_DN38590_c0_g1_i2.p2 TRINITY_DN38590_c0_g1~~TRINITY_DN38590_c0_g1_i2.p2  ORF type:complete len:172 (-),score=28.70 TRINITY_DN38590_c0_g1_i2:25-540(-)